MKQNYFKNIFLSFFALTFIFLSSCNHEPTPPPYIDPSEKSTTLIYAVATNSLSNNLVSDKKEILEAAPYIDLNKNNVLIFETTYNNDPQLIQLVKSPETETGYNFEVVKTYTNDISSLDPLRISEVLDFVASNFEASVNGLIFWSHSTASQPYNIVTKSVSVVEDNMSYSFGQDINKPLGKEFQINIDDLADAIPGNFYDYIWFDSCYMSNIESIYEFRNKCKFYVGYPTEVMDSGLPYDLVLPYLAKKDYDLAGGAQTFFNYYNEHQYSMYRVATVCLIDMYKVEILADYCSKLVNLDFIPGYRSLFTYTRGNIGPFYDLRDYILSFLGNDAYDSASSLDDILAEVIVYKAATNNDFNYNTIPQDRYSGISTHLYNTSDESNNEKYYQSLDWFERVF